MTNLDNPAARLNFWLQQGKQPAEAFRRQQKSHNHQGERAPSVALPIWAKIWDIDPSTPEGRNDCFDRGLLMIRNGMEVRTLVETSANSLASVAFEHFDQVEQALSHFAALPTTRIDTMMDCIADTGWHSLKVLDAMFRSDSPEQWLNNDQQVSLLQQTRDLVDAVLKSKDLTPTERQQIVDSLRKVEDALIRSDIAGGADIERAVDGVIGTLIRVTMRKGTAFLTHPVTQATFALANALSIALGMGADYTTLTSGTWAALPPGK